MVECNSDKFALRITSINHIYINGWLVDLNLINYWYNSKSWPSHSPYYAMNKLTNYVKLVYECGFDGGDRTPEMVLDVLQKYLQWIDYYGYRIEDICFKGGSVRYYRLIPGNEGSGKGDNKRNTRDEHYVVPQTWWKARDPERFPRIEL